MSTPKNPVLLVHGIGDTQRVFDPMAAYLRDRGWTVHALDLVPNNGSPGLDILAEQVQHYSQHHLAGVAKLDLIGFSMGGLVSRYYVQRLGGAARVQRFITISTPHNGTWLAHFRPTRGIRQMRPNSPFLQDLNKTVAQDLAAIAFTSLWTPYDLMILPARSSQLGLGQDIQIPAWTHPLMLRDRRSLQAIAGCLQQG